MINMNVAILGSTSSLGRCLISSLNDVGIDTTSFCKSSDYDNCISIDANNLDIEEIKKVFVKKYDCYIFTIGLLQPKSILMQSEEEIIKSMKVNALYIVKCCEYLFKTNANARVFIIGSESGRKGSFDTSYFLSKSMLRAYVRQRRVDENQQLLLISPSTIEDSSMTMDRTDYETLEKYRKQHPKKRFLYMQELTLYLTDIILNPSTYMSNVEIEINGGKFCRM